MNLRKKHKPLAKHHLRKLQNLKRHEYHPLQHSIHSTHHIAKRTLFYMKEYGVRSDAAKTILRESIKILCFAMVLSMFGGLALEYVRESLISFMPLIIVLPVLNGLIGNYGIIISSKFTTLLYTGKVTDSWLRNKEVRKLFLQVLLVAFITAILSASISLTITTLAGTAIARYAAMKLFIIVIVDVLVLVSALLLVAVYASKHFFKNNEDPNNFLIPITTSIADFGNMVVLSVLVWLMF